ncbi:MAG: type II toxin-antitoxin system RelE/ParE family toxin [Deltaproteobacteria bacterium]|nr:type II toxin-antitoxin system RelE/ParE family toxin [Deltaproteobacteria bacterium]
MTNFLSETTQEFDRDYRNIRKKVNLQERLKKKMKEILTNPYHYKTLRNVFKNKRRVHIGSFVLVFEIIEAESMIRFHQFKHHDEVYE